ncbi:MAG: polysaccharide lyase [Bacteroidales bacterium]
MKKLLLLCLLIGTGSIVSAQYPTIPSDRQAVMNQKKELRKKISDQAFARALPIIKEEAQNHNRPYVPWASKPEDLLRADIPAFPGAEGGAMYTPGGRGGKVLVVTNLNDEGPGSLRWACETGGARIVVFNVAGVIYLKSPIHIRAPYITIAGQTAPGDGVCVFGESIQMDTHDVVIRHLRIRRGNTDVTDREDALGGNPVGNILLDHISASWGADENISVYRHMYMNEEGRNLKLPTVNITIQNCIASEGLDTYNHSFGSTIGGLNNTFVRNLWACNTGRNPSMSSGEINYLNNVIYNWYHRVGDGAGYAYNIVNNYFKPGPVTPKDEPIGHRVFKVDGRNNRSDWAYIEGNYMEGNAEVSKDNWNGGVQEIAPELIPTTRRKEINPMMNPVEITDAKTAYKFVLKNAGANIPKRDPIDERIVRQVKSNKIEYVENGNYDALLEDMKALRVSRRQQDDSYKLGIIYDITQVGGLPAYQGKPRKDSDNDGMPDAWEIKYGLDPNDPSDAVKDCNGDGYTNIEKYINGINPKKKVDWTNPGNNYDTLAKKGKLL